MSIKQILVPLTGETRAEHVCDMAFAIGAKCKAHVVGTDTVSEPGPFLDQSGVGMMAAYYDELFKAADKVRHHKRINAAQAFDAVRARAGAVEGAIDLLMGLDGVDIIQVGDIKNGNASAESLADYLGWHGINATVKVLPEAGSDVAQAVIAAAKQCGATFLVMGAYGHSPLRELILGGVTKQMIEKADLPVLMAH